MEGTASYRGPVQSSDHPAAFIGEPRPRDFHARMTRKGRARAVLAQRHKRLHKSYAALAIALALPAMAGATDWATATPDNSGATRHTALHAARDQAGLIGADYTNLDGASAIHSDADNAPGSFADDLAAPGPVARPFFSEGSALDRARAEQCLTMAIYYEAATQPDEGQRAVAQVVLNRVAHPAFPNTVCGVVFQGSEHSTGCQFTFACDGSLARKPVAFWWDRARRVAQAALAGAVFAPVGLATHYHTLDVHPAWDDQMQRVVTIGAHAFYRWPGAAGQKAAFDASYLGGEPAALPHPRVSMPAPAGDDDPMVLARAYDASQATAAARVSPAVETGQKTALPAYSDAVQARGGDALFRSGNLPGGGDLSPELEHSGQWIDHQ